MASPIITRFLGDTSDLERATDRSQSRMSRLGGVASKMGAVIAAGAAAGVVALGALGLASVSSASDAQQSVGATETVFGKYADTVISRSEEAANAVGLSANQYRESSNLIGALFKNQGVAADQLAAKTDNMVKVGADLAATYGGTTREAVEALSSAFKGEFDPLERYGISIKQSSINAELAARGQDKLTGAALKQAQQQATTSLITRQAGDALGAFGRETGTLANRSQVLGAKWEDLKSKAGTVLLPVLTSLASFAGDTLIPAIERIGPPIAAFASAIGDRLSSVVSQFTGGSGAGFAGILTTVGGRISAVLPRVRAFAADIGQRLAPVVAAIADYFQGRLIPTFIRLRPTLVDIGTKAVRVASTFARVGSTVVGTVLPPLIRFAGFVASKVVPVVVHTISVILDVSGAMISFGSALVRGGRQALEFAGAVRSRIGDALEYVRSLPSRAINALGDLGSLLYDSGRALLSGFINGITSKIGDLTGAVSGALSKVRGLFPSSPAKEGPFSGRGWVLYSGQSIPGAMAEGIISRVGLVRAASERLARAARPDVITAAASPVMLSARRADPVQIAGGRYAPRGGGNTVIHVKVQASPGASPVEIGREIAKALRAYRATGGTI